MANIRSNVWTLISLLRVGIFIKPSAAHLLECDLIGLFCDPIIPKLTESGISATIDSATTATFYEISTCSSTSPPLRITVITLQSVCLNTFRFPFILSPNELQRMCGLQKQRIPTNGGERMN